MSKPVGPHELAELAVLMHQQPDAVDKGTRANIAHNAFTRSMDEPGFLDAYCAAVTQRFGDNQPTISYSVGGQDAMIIAILGAANNDHSMPQPSFEDTLLAAVDVSLLRAARAIHQPAK
jgi:hypothetical protein